VDLRVTSLFIPANRYYLERYRHFLVRLDLFAALACDYTQPLQCVEPLIVGDWKEYTTVRVVTLDALVSRFVYAPGLGAHFTGLADWGIVVVPARVCIVPSTKASQSSSQPKVWQLLLFTNHDE
jgi:hypothetical protein